MGIDSVAGNPEFQRLIRLQTQAFARKTPYHSLELLDGTVIPGLIPIPNLKARLDAYPLPEDLRGQRVLDIGAASGWNSFECERRGAEVVAVDCVEYEELTAVKRLRHPLLGLENVCAVTRGVAFIESFVIDSEPSADRCFIEFYETDELGGQIDNWCGPTTQCLISMVRAAGFPRVDFKYAADRRGGLVAHRRWEPVAAAPGTQPPFLYSAVNNRHDDNIFQPRKDEYLCAAFLHNGDLRREDVRLQIGQYGVPALILVKHAAGHWQVNAKVPPGISPGDHDVRVGTRDTGFSEPVRIRMLPAGADRRYGQTQFVPAAIEIAAPALIRAENTMDQTNIFRGYREEALAVRFTHDDRRLDLSQVQLTLDGNPWPLLSVEQPEPGIWQVKAKLKGLASGEHELRLRTARSPFSEPLTINSAPDLG